MKIAGDSLHSLFSFCSLDIKSALMFLFHVYELLSAIHYSQCKFLIFPYLTDQICLRQYLPYYLHNVLSTAVVLSDFTLICWSFPTFFCKLLEHVLLLTIPESLYDWLYQGYTKFPQWSLYHLLLPIQFHLHLCLFKNLLVGYLHWLEHLGQHATTISVHLLQKYICILLFQNSKLTFLRILLSLVLNFGSAIFQIILQEIKR